MRGRGQKCWRLKGSWMPKVCVKKGKKWRLTGSGRMEKSRWREEVGGWKKNST